jgi:hypothetical protein
MPDYILADKKRKLTYENKVIVRRKYSNFTIQRIRFLTKVEIRFTD